MNKYSIKVHIALILWICLSIPIVQADEDDDIDYADWAIEDLLQVRIVTSVGKKEQSLAHAPAAVYVVTSKEIQRSGVTTIADALRMVPGLQVAKMNAHNWAVSSRGFNGFFANKLLVLVDGRSVYSPEFSGVWWDTVDTVLDDIDRIEVIRGPGGTLWGANAVNGVINIITKHAKDTQGGLISVAAGNEEKNVTNLRYGGMLDEDTETYFRVYTKLLKRDGFANTAVADEWHSTQAGFRIDGHPFSKDNAWMLQVNAYRAKEKDMHWFTYQAGDTDAKGFHILSSLEHEFSEDSVLTAQVYYDEYQRKMPTLDVFNKVFDFDLQHRFALNDTHELMWGVGYRWLYNDIPVNPFFVFSPEKRIDNLFNAFIQDEIKLSDKHMLTIGTKVEHNDFSGWEAQPSIRYLWTPDDKWSLWSSVSRAVRTPSRREHDSFFATPLPQSQNPFYPIPFTYNFLGNKEFKSETVLAYELGIRQQYSQELSWDLSLFFNDYDKVLTDKEEIVADLAAGQAFLNRQIHNGMYGETFGLELAADYKTSNDFELHLAYHYLKITLHSEEGMRVFEGEDTENINPQHQLSLRMTNTLLDNVKLTTWLRYVSKLDGNTPQRKIDAYTTFDAKLSWHVTDDLELSIVGQNLFDKQYFEFFNAMTPLYGEIERSVYGQIRWEF